MILVFDGCTDNSVRQAMTLLRRVCPSLAQHTRPGCPSSLTRIRTIVESNDMFEATACNAALALAQGTYVLLSQDDVRAMFQLF